MIPKLRLACSPEELCSMYAGKDTIDWSELSQEEKDFWEKEYNIDPMGHDYRPSVIDEEE